MIELDSYRFKLVIGQYNRLVLSGYSISDEPLTLSIDPNDPDDKYTIYPYRKNTIKVSHKL